MSIFFLIAGIHFFGVISPGPVLIGIFNHTLKEKYVKNVIPFISGIVLGDAVIMTLVLGGLSDFIIGNTACNVILHLLGGSFLLYIGISNMRMHNIVLREKRVFAATLKGGFLFILANPNVILFYIGLFTMIVEIDTPQLVKLGYATWILLMTLVYFFALVCIFHKIKKKILSYILVLSKIFGLGMCGFALLVLCKGLRLLFI